MLLSASFTCLDACCCHGLRLPVFNKETTYLLMNELQSPQNVPLFCHLQLYFTNMHRSDI